MQSYKHILLATDFSDISYQAALTAKEMVTRCKAKLTIAHCIESMPALIGEMESPAINHAEEKLEELINQLGLSDVNLEIAFGTTKKVLLEIAKNLAVDLIIVGSHGHHGFAQLLGSTANAIIHTAPCDVLVVRPSQKALGDHDETKY